jgi:hypothetical protein
MGEGSVIGSQGIFDQSPNLRNGALFVLKDPLISFFPNIPPEEEHNSYIHLLLCF